PELCVDVEVTSATNPLFGDYQCNSAMKLAKLLKIAPRAVAESLIAHYPGPERLEIAGPGFINLFIENTFLEAELEKVYDSPRLAIETVSPLKVVMDFSSPNIAKEMHVGHLRSTIIGDSLARMLEFLGYDVLRLNHVGDFGTSFGMLIAYMQDFNPQDFSLQDLMVWYKASKERFDTDEAFKKKAQMAVVSLQKEESIAVAYWEKICEISRKAFQEIYDLLDIHLIERGESYYGSQLAHVVSDLEEKGLVTLSSGAKCIFLEGFKNREGDLLPLMVQKSDGGYNYDTTDMATIHQRIVEEKADWLIYVTDAGQSTHFQMIFQAAEKAGYLDRSRMRIDHVPFGLVLGNDGKKFRTRSGETEKLIDLIHAAVQKAAGILQERGGDLTIAPILGLNAIKYADLSVARTSDYHFSYDKMLQFEGNTAAFLMYAYVRAQSILKRCGTPGKLSIEHPSERTLALRLLRFHEALNSSVEELLPHRLCDYLFHLAEEFHGFFRDCHVEGHSAEKSRLKLCDLTARTLREGMSLLGLKLTERM
ncbi:MAG: arginine--tRNA ligase, partial [Chlamydiota bacterium]